jgi:peptide/nickel transport system substrate-binding protein/dipeptide transport system substrate-binding protein
MIDPQLPFNVAFPATFVYPQSLGLDKMIAGIDRLGDHAVRFSAAQGQRQFLSYFARVVRRHPLGEYAGQLLAQGRASAINNLPVGTGPYQFKSYRKDDVLRLLAHPGHWGGVQRTERWSMRISREPNVRVQKLARRMPRGARRSATWTSARCRGTRRCASPRRRR